MNQDLGHPITLEQVLFVRSVVVAIPEYQPDPQALGLQEGPTNHINISPIDGQPGRFSATMRTTINPEMKKTSPYFIDMECTAILIANDSLTPEDALRGVTMTGHSVVYGAIREAVLWMTGRQPYGPLSLGLSVLKTQEASTGGTD